MSSIVSKPGDTFDTLARRAYGDDRHADMLRTANPGVAEPLAAGVRLTAPRTPLAPTRGRASGPSELALVINGKPYTRWTGVTVTRALDTLATASLTTPHNPGDPLFREAFRPMSYADTGVTLGGAPLFTGTMLTPTPSVTAEGRVVSSASCYAAPGVLADCTPPSSMSDRLEWGAKKGVSLRVIAEALAAPFGVKVTFGVDPGSLFEDVSLDPDGKVLPFLVKLAQQNGLLVTDTPEGGLLFDKPSAVGRPVAHLVEGTPPVLGVSPVFSPQEYFSVITGLGPVTKAEPGGSKTTVKNPHLAGVFRPFTFQLDDTRNADAQTAVRGKMGRMFAGAVEYPVEVSGLRDPQGALWTPNTTVTLDAPGAMVYGPYEFLIRAVSLSHTDDGGDRSSLQLVLPGVFNGEIPERLPWDE